MIRTLFERGYNNIFNALALIGDTDSRRDNGSQKKNQESSVNYHPSGEALLVAAVLITLLGGTVGSFFGPFGAVGGFMAGAAYSAYSIATRPV